MQHWIWIWIPIRLKSSHLHKYSCVTHFRGRTLVLKLRSKTWVHFLRTAFCFEPFQFGATLWFRKHSPGPLTKIYIVHSTHSVRFPPTMPSGLGHIRNKLEGCASAFSPMIISIRLWESHNFGPWLEGDDNSKLLRGIWTWGWRK